MEKITVTQGDKYIVLDVDELVKSQSNVRDKHDKHDISNMAASITHRGIINAPCVAKNGAGFEIIAGNLRIAGAIKAGVKKIKCKDVTSLDEAGRVEISLSENIDRARMSSIELFKAFDKLFRAGRTVSEIGARFGKTQRETQQLLAIGGLPKKLLNLAESGVVGDRTLEALACVAKVDVDRYLKLPADKRPRNWDIEAWLAGADGEYLAANALFDLADYDGGSRIDLFARDADERYLTDGTKFWELQDGVIATWVTDKVKKGYVVEQLVSWTDWGYERKAKKDGGKAYYTRNEKTGAVSFHVGYARMGRAGAAPAAKKDGSKPEKKAEISQTFNLYLAQIRHQEVCDELLTNKRKGMMVAILLVLKSMDNWSVRDEQYQTIKADGYLASLLGSEIGQRLIKADNELHKFLKIKDKDGYTDVQAIAQVLNKATLAELAGFMSTLVATRWHGSYSGDNSDTIGKLLGISACDNWHHDKAFWDGITNRDTLLAIAKGEKITLPQKATMKVMRSILAEKISDEWIPKWLTF